MRLKGNIRFVLTSLKHLPMNHRKIEVLLQSLQFPYNHSAIGLLRAMYISICPSDWCDIVKLVS